MTVRAALCVPDLKWLLLSHWSVLSGWLVLRPADKSSLRRQTIIFLFNLKLPWTEPPVQSASSSLAGGLSKEGVFQGPHEWPSEFPVKKVRLQGGRMLTVVMFRCSRQPWEHKGRQYLFESLGKFLSSDAISVRVDDFFSHNAVLLETQDTVGPWHEAVGLLINTDEADGSRSEKWSQCADASNLHSL